MQHELVWSFQRLPEEQKNRVRFLDVAPNFTFSCSSPAEQLAVNQPVGGSIPSRRAKFLIDQIAFLVWKEMMIFGRTVTVTNPVYGSSDKISRWVRGVGVTTA